MKRYLCVTTSRKRADGSIQEFDHFIDLENPTEDMKYLLFHLDWFKGQEVVKTAFYESRPTNW